MVTVHSRRLAVEMAVKRLDIYGNRPTIHSFNLSGWSRITALLNGSDWKEHRRYMARVFGTRQLMQNLWGVEVFEVRKFLRNVLRSPEALEEHLRQYVV